MIELFIPIRIIDVIDILLVAFLLFQLYNLVKGTTAINIFIGIISIYLFWKIVDALEMKMLSEILGQFISVGVIALIIVFQQEIRQFLLFLGTPTYLKNSPLRFLFSRWKMTKNLLLDINSIAEACKQMSRNHIGALIVISNRNELKQFIETGELIDAKLSHQLIENIFSKNAPLHDGAIIIRGNKIKAARCILPLTEITNIPPHLGLRHRAAIGVTEKSDAIAIAVSEQNGMISYCKHGKITTNISFDNLKTYLKNELG